MKKNIRGISLVSLIIGVSLSTIIFTSISGVFSSSKANQSLSEAMNDLNQLAKNLENNIYSMLTQAGSMIPNAGTGLNPTYVSAFVESNYSSAPGGVAPSNGLVLGYFNYNAVNTNLWIKTYGNASGLIRSCAGVETSTAQDFRIILFSQTFGGQTGFYCAKQVWGQTAAAAMANPVTLIAPQNFDSVYVKFAINSMYMGCYADPSLPRRLPMCNNAGIINASNLVCTSVDNFASCQNRAVQNGYNLFAVQSCAGNPNTCQCFMGPKTGYTFAIANGTGTVGQCNTSKVAGANGNQMYSLSGALSKWVNPSSLSSYTDQTTATSFTTLNVPAVRYVFLLKSSSAVFSTATTKTFQFMDNSTGSQISRVDQYAYRLVVITVPLVNNLLRTSVQ